jgi:hypothetical protein
VIRISLVDREAGFRTGRSPAMSVRAIQLSTARVVLNRFPDRSDQILRLYDTVDDVQHICDDLALAIVTLQRFEARIDQDRAGEISDYREIIDKLQAELIQLLDGHN